MDAYDYLFNDDSELLEALEAYEDGEAADRAMALYQAREEQRTFQRDLIEQHGGSIQSDQPGRFVFNLQPISTNVNRRFGLLERRFNVNLQQEGNIIDNITPALRDAMERAMREVVSDPNLDGNYRVFFDLFSDRLAHGTYRGNGMRVQDFRDGGDSVDAVFERLQSTLNSNESFAMDDTFQMEIMVVRPPNRQGSGRKTKNKPGYQKLQDFIVNKKTILRINNKDDNCGARATMTAKAIADEKQRKLQNPNYRDPRLQRLKKGGRLQEVLAKELYRNSGVPEGPVGRTELSKFQEYLGDGYRLIVVYAEERNACYAFTPYKEDQVPLVLYHHDNHYDVVTSLPGFFNQAYFCPYCLQGYGKEGHHRCTSTENKVCPCCRQPNCSGFASHAPQKWKATIPCHHCRRFFFNQQCYENHQRYSLARQQKPENSVCLNVRRCKLCGKQSNSFKAIRAHQCGTSKCPSCEKFVIASEHKCFIKPDKKRKRLQESEREVRVRLEDEFEIVEALQNAEGEEPSEKEQKEPLHVYFDSEAMQHNGTHEANLLVYQSEEMQTSRVLSGSTCVEQFLDELKELTEENTRQVYAMAHNLQAYDGYFIIQKYYEHGQEVYQIRCGAKIISLSHFNVRFTDSLNFFAMPLSSFPSTFGLEEAAKGFFPHLFNRPENQDYVGPTPEAKYFMPETMSVEKKAEFDTYYENARKPAVLFNFKKELVRYCKSDVKLLKEGCQTFQKLFMEHSGFNPFEKLTIASACNQDLRNNCMYPDTIAVEPPHGWAGLKGNASKESLEWFNWLNYSKRQELMENMSEEDMAANDLMEIYDPEFQNPSKKDSIQHAGNGGEHYVPAIRTSVDGYCAETNTIYQYQGCFWHGCESCYPNRTEKHFRLDDRTMYEVREKTRETTTKLRSAGYHVIEMWGCEWRKQKKDNPECLNYANNLSFMERLNPRDAFFGGRTNAAKLYHRVKPTQKIHYIDVTSLYPYVNKKSKYPIKHPEIITNPDTTDIDDYFGLIKCTVRPPKKLYHPVLPKRSKGKLLFPLCDACVQEEMDKPYRQRTTQCHHLDIEREFTGTWCSPELVKAVEMGYTIIKIHEVYHFSETQEGLFDKYVNKWLKVKQEASGWPSWCRTEAQKQAYIQDYREKEGIQLEYENIRKNPGLRTVAKLMLNSMWGKFGQKPNKTQVAQFTDPIEFHHFISSDQLDIHKIQMHQNNENVVEVFYTKQQEDMDIQPNLNIFIACFTTCYARLKLYEALEMLGERVLYYDTDSVIYVQNLDDPTEQQPVLGDYLGDFTNELKGDDFIVEFASAGPKNYGYLTAEGKTECKVKGFSLNTEGSKYINYELLRDNVKKEIQNPLYHPRKNEMLTRQYPVKRSYRIVRNPNTYELETKEEIKNYQLVYDKRVVDPDTFKTYPYGYGDLEDSMEHTDINTLLDM